jgi:hypothetical protein
MPYISICPYCQYNVQTTNPLPVGRPVKCPSCKNMYTAGPPGTMGTGPALAPRAPAPPVPAGTGKTPPQGFLLRFMDRIGSMAWKTLAASSFFLFMFGVVPLVFAWSEWSVSSTSTVDPLAMDLAELEKGTTPQNNHVKIGPHTGCYFATVSSYTVSKKGARRRPDATTKVDYTYYPIISASHPYYQEVKRIQDKYSKADKVPDDIDWPALSDFRVLVKTTRFRTFGDIPDDDARSDNFVQGMIINRISMVGTEEQRLIRQDFPNIDFNKVLILSEGRRPSSGFFVFFLICLGLFFWFWLFGLAGVWLYCRLFRRA